MATVAQAKDYYFFYEFKTMDVSSTDSCQNGELSEFVDTLEAELKEYSDVNIKFLCVPKSVLFADAPGSEVLVIPFAPKSEALGTILRSEINQIIDDLNIGCTTVSSVSCLKLQTAEPFPYSREKYSYKSLEELQYFDEDEYDVNALYEIITKAKDPLFVKLVQSRLKLNGHDPGIIDGDPGKKTKTALNEYMLKLAETLSLDQPIETTTIVDDLFYNLLKYKGNDINQETGGRTISNVNRSDIVGATDPGNLPTSEQMNSTADHEEFDPTSQTKQADGDDTLAPEFEPHGASKKNNSDLSLITTLEKQNRELLDYQVLLEQQIELLKAKNAELKRSKSDAENLTLKELFEEKSKKLKIIGAFPNGDTIDIEKNVSASFSTMCDFRADENIEDAFIRGMKSITCLRLSQKDLEENNRIQRVYDHEKEILTIALVKPQNEVILSIRSEVGNSFSETDASGCYIGLLLLDEEAYEANNAPINLFMEFVEQSGEVTGLLSDYQIDEMKLQWRGKQFEFVDLTPTSEVGSCTVQPHKPFPIIQEGDSHNGFDPIAIVNREGNISLQNIPIVKRQAPELHVFLDTLAGPEGDENYGFNAAIGNESDKETQRIYFEGFLNGVQNFLDENDSFESLTIHHTIMEGNVKKTVEVYTIHKNDLDLENVSLTDKFVKSYINNFEAGVAGEFDNKKRKYNQILTSNGNARFITFGSSGMNPGRVCQAKQKRSDYNDNSIIFDIVPPYTFDRLAELNDVKSLERGFASRCINHDRIVVMRPRKTKTAEDVSFIVTTQLSVLWRP